MKRWPMRALAVFIGVFCTFSNVAAQQQPHSFECADASVAIEAATGRIISFSAKDGRPVTKSCMNVYRLMTKSGTTEAVETGDRVISKSDSPGLREYRCTNPKLPGLEIIKTYRLRNKGLGRTLEFRRVGEAADTAYVQPFTECCFEDAFRKGAWHFGAGYMGPIKPFAVEKEPRPVNEFRQSSKGMVFFNPNSDAGSFAHYRVKINDTVVLPWWHSTIGHYREYEDRLWFLPDGYKMCLGTFDVRPGKSVTIHDQFVFFDGNLHSFFENVFDKDEDFMREIKSIPPPPKWIENIYIGLPSGPNSEWVAWMADLAPKGSLLLAGACVMGGWADYRPKEKMMGHTGGTITGQEVLEYTDAIRALRPNLEPWHYHIVISAGASTRVLADKPQWFRRRDRNGIDDPLFPGLFNNYQTMFNNADCREWLVDMLCGFSRFTRSRVIYLDETQMTNTIDWDRDQVTLDSDTVKFWQMLKARAAAMDCALFYNGSGLPYADINYMESPHELAPERWRDWAGVAWGIGMMNRLRPGQRTIPLYWVGDLDYANRVLALGWIPNAHEGTMRLGVQNGVWDAGNLWPADVRYAPDWRRDAETNIESHAMTRADADDVLVSFINRGDAADIPIEINLGTCGFKPGARVNVWCAHLDLGQNDNADTLSAPELVYSGVAEGRFRYVIEKLGKNKMEQFLVTISPLSFYAVDSRPLTLPYTAQRVGKIMGGKVTLKEAADFALFDLDKEFSEVTVNGEPVMTRVVDMGGLGGTWFSLAAGEHTVAWKESPRRKDAPKGKKIGESVMTARRKARKMFRWSIYGDPVKTIEKLSSVRDGVKVTERAEFIDRYDILQLIQTNMLSSVARADADKLVLEAGTTRRQSVNRHQSAWAGFEFDGARQIRFRFEHTFTTPSVMFDHKGGYLKENEVPFMGFMIDYRVDGTYVKRAGFACGMFKEKNEQSVPPWGKKRKPDELYELGELIDERSGRVFSLDLAKYAPTNWDGVAYVSVGVMRVKPDRRIKISILDFNNINSDDFLVPLEQTSGDRRTPEPIFSKPLKTKPQSLTSHASEEWKTWSQANTFRLLKAGMPRVQTRAYLAHDYEHIYFAVECDEPGRDPIVRNTMPMHNEHIEFIIIRPDGKTTQTMVDGRGSSAFFLSGKHNPDVKTVAWAENIPGKGWRAFVSVPIEYLKLDMQRTPVKVKFNICRVRRGGHPEHSSWSPMPKGYFDVHNYGELILDFNW